LLGLSSTTFDENIVCVRGQRSQIVEVATRDRAARFGCGHDNGIEGGPLPGKPAVVSRPARELLPQRRLDVAPS